MTRVKRTAILFLVLSTALVVGLEASARTERLRWTHPDPDGVDGYRVHYGTESRVYTLHIDVGALTPDPDGVCVYDLVDVDDAATIYVAVTAYAGGLESVASNERVRAPSQEPEPPPAGTIGTPGRPILITD